MINTEKNLISSSVVKGSAAFAAVGMILGGYKRGFQIVEGTHPNAIERFVVLRVNGSPRLLLPLAEPVMRTATMSFLGNRRFAGLVPSVVRFASRMGGPFSYVSTNVSLTSQSDVPSPLRELMSNVLGRNDFQIALRLSFNRPNAKTVAMAISDVGEELCYAKFGSEAMTNDLVAHESAIFEHFENTTMPVIMPKRLYSGTWADGHNVLITAPLGLEPFKRDASSAHLAADAFASQNLVSSSALCSSTYWHKMIERIEKLDDSHSGSEPLRHAVTRIQQTWSDVNFDFGANHGDWSRANLGLVDGRVAALDWERCTLFAPRGIDVAHFAICEKSFRTFGKSVDIERVAEYVRQFLNAVGLPPDNARPLIILALLEMVVRFKSAQSAGIRSTDPKFEPALREGLQKWAV